MADLMRNATMLMDNISYSSNVTDVDLPKTVSLVFIFVLSLFGNVCTVAIVSQFKQHKLPDVLVIGLACTDLIATFIPVPMSLYSYITLQQFDEGSFACNFYGTVAQFTRYASVLIVTIISLERYFAVNRPFIYRTHATPRKCIAVLICCWILALALALAPALDSNTPISSHDGFCLFDFSSNYAISIVVYGAVQFFIVLVCFILVTVNLLRVYRRRKELRVQGSYNKHSQAKEREHEVTFNKPNLSSRISDLGSALKKAAPLITEKFQLGVEAQFARMLFAVVALFYVSWTTIVILITIAQVRQSQKGLSLALFWGIRLSIISLALNPLLYGLLARQYRLAYLYVLRKIFSCCCSCCVHPPLKDVFDTARTTGGDMQGEPRQSALQRRRMPERHYGSQSNRSMNGSLWSAHTRQPVLTHTTHISLDLLPQLEEVEYLSTIQEESMYDHSTYIPSAGELSSTVVIPHQARENYEGTPKLDHKHPKTSSEHNLTDIALYEHPPFEKHTGSHNPLAIIADIQGESAVTEPCRKQKRFPPLEAIDAHGLETGKVYDNPVYEKKFDSCKEKEKDATKLSLPFQLSILRTSQLKANHSSSMEHDSTTNVTQHTLEGEKSRLAPTKKPVEITRSSPLAFLKGSKKKQKLRATHTLPPTLDPNSTEGEESVITSVDEDGDLDVVIDTRHLAPPVTSGRQLTGYATRASARTYNEMKRNLNPRLPSRPISSSHSFVDSPLTINASSSMINDTSVHVHVSATHDSAIGLSPRYQVSLSPIPPPPHTHPATTSQSSSNTYTPTATISPSQPPPPSLRDQTLPSTNMTSSFAATPPSIAVSSQPSQSLNKQTPSPTQTRSKYSVKELRQRFESITSTPPTSPTSATSTSPSSHPSSYPIPTSTHYHCTDTDSGRESMVELVITDI